MLCLHSCFMCYLWIHRIQLAYVIIINTDGSDIYTVAVAVAPLPRCPVAPLPRCPVAPLPRCPVPRCRCPVAVAPLPLPRCRCPGAFAPLPLPRCRCPVAPLPRCPVAPLPLPRCRCPVAVAPLPLPRCRCPGAVAPLPLPRCLCRCPVAVAPLPLPHCRCPVAVAPLPLPRCRCPVAVAPLPLPRCRCPVAVAPLPLPRCRCPVAVAPLPLPLPRYYYVYCCWPHLPAHPLHEITQIFGLEKSLSLPLFHSFIGCDTTSPVLGIGKKTAWAAWQVYPYFTETQFSLSSPSVYGTPWTVQFNNISGCPMVNDARRQFFTHIHGRFSTPQTTLLQHARVALSHADYIWRQARQQHDDKPDGSTWS